MPCCNNVGLCYYISYHNVLDMTQFHIVRFWVKNYRQTRYLYRKQNRCFRGYPVAV